LIVVSDTSPILNLAAVGRLDLLRVLYRDVVIPPAVDSELLNNGFDHVLQPWIVVRQPSDSSAVDALKDVLDAGESEAIVLAEEIHADLLLIDERRGWRVTVERAIPSTGLLGVLAEAKKRGHIPACRPILDSLIEAAGFWISSDLREKYLASMHEGDRP
jgi:predicted nucleic acid-binding protein